MAIPSWCAPETFRKPYLGTFVPPDASQSANLKKAYLTTIIPYMSVWVCQSCETLPTRVWTKHSHVPFELNWCQQSIITSSDCLWISCRLFVVTLKCSSAFKMQIPYGAENIIVYEPQVCPLGIVYVLTYTHHANHPMLCEGWVDNLVAV